MWGVSRLGFSSFRMNSASRKSVGGFRAGNRLEALDVIMKCSPRVVKSKSMGSSIPLDYLDLCEGKYGPRILLVYTHKHMLENGRYEIQIFEILGKRRHRAR